MTGGEIAVSRMRRHFSEHADEYDRYALVQKTVAATLLALLPPDATRRGLALDLGTGTGELAERFRGLHPHTPLALADIAHGMTRCAAARLPGTPAFDADAEALPVADGACGLVLSSSMYQWVNDLPRAFAEAARVLKPGGVFALALFGEQTLCELRESHISALTANGCAAPSHMQRFPSAETVRTAMAHAGFATDIRVDSLVEEHADVATLLRHLKRIGAQNVAQDRPPGLAGRRTTLHMMEIYRERYGRNGTIPVSWQVIYGIGRKPE